MASATSSEGDGCLRDGTTERHGLKRQFEASNARNMASESGPSTSQARVAAVAARLYYGRPPSGMSAPSALNPLRQHGSESRFTALPQSELRFQGAYGASVTGSPLEPLSCSWVSVMAGSGLASPRFDMSGLGSSTCSTRVLGPGAQLECSSGRADPMLASDMGPVSLLQRNGGGRGISDTGNDGDARAFPGFMPGSRIVEGWELGQVS